MSVLHFAVHTALHPAAAGQPPDAAALPARLKAALRRWSRAAAALQLAAEQDVRLALARRERVVLRGLRGQALVCESGELWVTLDGDTADHVLQRGERLAVAANACAVVTATRASLLRVTALRTMAAPAPHP
ncbi:DUF2917 domain-containing protein [Azohydromonas aeria]|uniref:DUF2917 domain-containing protein n=1 Tax=Azohydromonas aeria TaxID=2590212 RepID=UPI0012FCD3C0|nr:DUF2917 domain-containing protein [Azohydromonas aeria]